MADITQTAASVAAGTGADIDRTTGVAGVTIVAGDVLYKDATDSNKLKKAINTGTASANAVGVALNGGAAGQPIAYHKKGDINPGGTVVVGEVYNVSPNAGKFAPDADILTATYRKVLGVGTSASNIRFQLQDADPILLP